MTAAYRLEEVAHRYGAVTALNIGRLELKAGKRTALIGPNGAGKSTLLGLLAFLYRPSIGDIVFFGRATAQTDLLALRRRVGLVAQKPYMMRGTVADNIGLGLKLRGVSSKRTAERVQEVLKKLEIERFAERSANTLSGGESQKAALARALVLEPEVLLFDEPFTYLDSGSTEMIEALIAEYTRQSGRTVVFSTHDRVHGMALADEVVSLFSGREAPAPMINLFRGRVAAGRFDTGKITIHLPADITEGGYAALDPNEIVISAAPLNSSIRNRFNGRVVTVAEENGKVRVVVDAGERFQVLITHHALEELRLGLGDAVWVHFKATAVRVFS